jgi:hypothetical protein
MIGGSTPTFGAATTTKALPAQTWHKVPLDNSSDDFSNWSETMHLALNNRAPWPMADGSKCGPQNPVPDANSTNDCRDSLASQHQGDGYQCAISQILADKQYHIGTSRGKLSTTSDTTAGHVLKTQADIRQRYPWLIDSRAPRITHSHRSQHCPSCYVLALPLLFLIPPHPLTHLRMRPPIPGTALP